MAIPPSLPLSSSRSFIPPSSFPSSILPSTQEPECKEPSLKTKSTQTRNIFLIETSSPLFHHIPDVGMDRLLVSNGQPIGTSGVATCFAICSMGTSNIGTPVLGLCHTSDLVPFKIALRVLKSAMVRQQGAIINEIDTSVIGGQLPVPQYDYPGTLATEQQILDMVKTERIKGVLFNQTQGEREDSVLNVVLTSDAIYASHDLLFELTGEDAGESL